MSVAEMAPEKSVQMPWLLVEMTAMLPCLAMKLRCGVAPGEGMKERCGPRLVFPQCLTDTVNAVIPKLFPCAKSNPDVNR